MITHKIAILGAFGVGKTSLVQRFVENTFSEKYLTTLGVAINKKIVIVDHEEISLILWDIAGEDEFQKVKMYYLRGSSGYILVGDGTRPATLETAYLLYQRVVQEVGNLPFVFILNKADLHEKWVIDDVSLDTLVTRGWPVMIASAKTGLVVEQAFMELAKKIIGAAGE